jgi:hypothetical protein
MADVAILVLFDMGMPKKLLDSYILNANKLCNKVIRYELPSIHTPRWSGLFLSQIGEWIRSVSFSLILTMGPLSTAFAVSLFDVPMSKLAMTSVPDFIWDYRPIEIIKDTMHALALPMQEGALELFNYMVQKTLPTNGKMPDWTPERIYQTTSKLQDSTEKTLLAAHVKDRQIELLWRGNVDHETEIEVVALPSATILIDSELHNERYWTKQGAHHSICEDAKLLAYNSLKPKRVTELSCDWNTAYNLKNSMPEHDFFWKNATGPIQQHLHNNQLRFGQWSNKTAVITSHHLKCAFLTVSAHQVDNKTVLDSIAVICGTVHHVFNLDDFLEWWFVEVPDVVFTIEPASTGAVALIQLHAQKSFREPKPFELIQWHMLHWSLQEAMANNKWANVTLAEHTIQAAMKSDGLTEFAVPDGRELSVEKQDEHAALNRAKILQRLVTKHQVLENMLHLVQIVGTLPLHEINRTSPHALIVNAWLGNTDRAFPMGQLDKTPVSGGLIEMHAHPGSVNKCVASVDFRSAYPEKFIQLRQSPELYQEDGTLAEGEGAVCKFLQGLLDERQACRNDPNLQPRQRALKLVANEFYGIAVLHFSKCAAAVTRACRYELQAVIRRTEENPKYKVLSAHTDGLLVKIPDIDEADVMLDWMRDAIISKPDRLRIDKIYDAICEINVNSSTAICDGIMKCRGTACRRADTPKVIRELEHEIHKVLLTSSLKEEIFTDRESVLSKHREKLSDVDYLVELHPVTTADSTYIDLYERSHICFPFSAVANAVCCVKKINCFALVEETLDDVIDKPYYLKMFEKASKIAVQ